MGFPRIFKSLTILVTILLFNIITFVAHASTATAMSYDMAGMHHSSDNSALCATQCRTAVLSNEEVNSNDRDDEEDEPALPFYALLENQPSHLHYHANAKIYLNSVKPPPKVPIYKLFGVFRI